VLARLSVLTVALTGAASAGEPPALVAVELQTPDGGKTQLTAALKGRPTLISLWATWCESCAAEFGALGKLATKAAEKGAYVVAISEGETPEAVKAFVKARGLTYPQLIDEKFIVADSIGQRSIPATLVVDKRGKIIFRGAALDREALQALDRAIDGRL
jgi:thiol-disulfide isomerase/thioredoxin